MKTSEIDKTIKKIKKLLIAHSNQGEFLELEPIIKNRTFNLYLTGRLNGTIYERKHIATITTERR